MSDQEIQDLISSRHYAQAETLIAERIKTSPQDADAAYLLGVLRYFQGQVGPAIENLRKALSLDPHHTDAAICLSVLFNDIGKYDEARRVFEQANQSVNYKKAGVDFTIDRKFAVKHLELGDLYFRYRRYDEAIEEYTKGTYLDPSAHDIKIRRARAYAKKGFITRAMQELQQLKREQPDFFAARIQLGLLHYSQGNLLDAEIEWEGVLERDPVHREARAYTEMSRRSRERPSTPGFSPGPEATL